MRSIGLAFVAALVVASAVPPAWARGFPPRMTVSDQVGKDQLVAIIGANLIMNGGLGRSQVVKALTGLERHLDGQLRTGDPAVVYPEVVLSIVKNALLRGWSGAETAAVLSDALGKIETGRSPELVRQVVVLAIVRDHRPAAVLVELAMATREPLRPE